MSSHPHSRDGALTAPDGSNGLTQAGAAGPTTFDSRPLSVRTLLGIPTLAVFPQGAQQPTTQTALSPRPPNAVERVRPRAEMIVRPHEFPAMPDPRLVMLGETSIPQAASFRSLRHRLAERGNPRRVLVTSAGPREGKTVAAVNLALALAESGRFQVLLIETNTHRPTLADMFGLAADQYTCFFEQLEQHRAKLDDPWKVTAVGPKALHVLPIAPSSAGARRAIDPPLFGEMMARFKQSYDYIIVDGPAILSGGDVTLLEDAVDGVLVVAQAGRSRGRQMRAAMEQLSPESVVGVVLIDG